MSATLPTGLTLLVREECDLCDEFAAQFERLRTTLPLPPLALLDVDSDPLLQRRYGLRIPMLLWDGVPVCSTRLDRSELERLFRPRGGGQPL